MQIPDPHYWLPLLRLALDEDLGTPWKDLSAQLLTDQYATASIKTREPMTLCGQCWVNESFKQLDNLVQIHWHHHDGDHIDAHQIICTIEGNLKAILSAERTALNGLQTLSATATTTQQYAAKIQHTQCKLLDTRKTLPGFRHLQKYAVQCGGGHNHRMGLFDAILLKENHLHAAGSMSNALKNHSSIHVKWMIEVETQEELKQALDHDISHIMLDNFSLEQMQRAVQLNQGKARLEVSGNVTLDTIQTIAETGIDYVSVGALTKHIQAIDLSLTLSR